MVIGKYSNIKISAVSAAVSSQWISLDTMKTEENSKVIDKLKKTTGVQGRYDAGLYQTTADFCYAAAEEIIKTKSIERESIGILVFVSQTRDYSFPATACLLAHRLGLSKECMAFDVSLGCSGYVYGLNIVGALMNNSNVDKGLLLVGDTSAKEFHHKKKLKSSYSADAMLFGDSGTATLLEKTVGETDLIGVFRTDGAGYKAIISPYGSWRHPDCKYVHTMMDGTEVFKFAIGEVPVMVKDYLEYTNTTPDDYDCFVPHQANRYILKTLAKRTGFPYEKFLVSIDIFANTSSASIPVSFVKEYGESWDGKVRALMCGYGVGLSWGIVSTVINKADILPLVHTDEYFDDGYPDEFEDENS